MFVSHFCRRKVKCLFSTSSLGLDAVVVPNCTSGTRDLNWQEMRGGWKSSTSLTDRECISFRREIYLPGVGCERDFCLVRNVYQPDMDNVGESWTHLRWVENTSVSGRHRVSAGRERFRPDGEYMSFGCVEHISARCAWYVSAGKRKNQKSISRGQVWLLFRPGYDWINSLIR